MKAIFIGRLPRFARFRTLSTTAVAGVCCMSLYWAGSTAAVASSLPAKAADLFQTTNIWNVHLQFIPEQLVTSGSDAEFAARVSEFVDLEQFARFMSVTVWLSTMDSILMMGQNFYVYLHPATHQFQFVPWDLDHSFGQFPMGGTQHQRENLSIHTPWRGANRFLERMFKNETFKKLYIAALTEFSKSIFQPENISHEEFVAGFAKWFSNWNTDKSGALTEAQLREGINRDLMPFHGGPPGGPDSDPADGPPEDQP